MVGVAVNVTEVPAQIAPDGEADMLTLAGNRIYRHGDRYWKMRDFLSHR